MPKEDTQFKPGNKLGGRPKGARNKLGEDFIHALHDDFALHGAGVIAEVRADKPSDYMKIIASILPKELKVTVDPLEELSDADLDKYIKQLASALSIEVRNSEGSSDQAETAELQPSEPVRTLQ
jgi:hypothetical protein